MDKEIRSRNYTAVLVDRHRGHLNGASGHGLGRILLFDKLPGVGDHDLKCAVGAFLDELFEEI
jgi:hypothetical protein